MPRKRTLRSEAVVLRRTDFGEADRLLTLFTREVGKMRALAKGARKPASRKTGHVELFMRTNFLIALGRDWGIVTQAEMIEAYTPLREDLVSTTYAAYFVELLDRFTAEEDKNVVLYNLINQALGWLCTAANPLLVARHYELRLLSATGYQPQLFRCVASGEEIAQEAQFFSAEMGGLLCPQQRNVDKRAKPISAGAVKVLRYLQTRPWETVQSLQLRRDLHQELEHILHFYLTYILERNLKSVDFLQRLRREASIFTVSTESEAEPPVAEL